MFRKSSQCMLLPSALLLAGLTQAGNLPRMVVAPQCLAKQITVGVKPAAYVQDFALLQVDEKGLSQLAHAKHGKSACGGFVDVTQDWKAFHAKHLSAADNDKAFLTAYLTPVKSLQKAQKTYSIQHAQQVNELLGQIVPQLMWDNLAQLTKYKDRYADSDLGVEASGWIKAQIEAMAKNAGRDDITFTEIPTTDYKQNSIVVKVGNGSGPGIVVGGHMDTLSMNDWMSPGVKPGADDDGSGTVTVMEVARVIISSNMRFNKPVYFIWYAAEEEGLYGSVEVVKHFKKNNIPVDAVLQLDMTGYAPKNAPTTIWMITDRTDSALNTFVTSLVKEYVKQPVNTTKCNYGCSDHDTWTQNGFAASFPFEAEFGKESPYIHTSKDTLDTNKISLQHMTDFAKLGTAFVVELAEPAAIE